MANTQDTAGAVRWKAPSRQVVPARVNNLRCPSGTSALRAPRKQFIALEGGGHFVAFMRPDAFLNELIRNVLPLTRRD